MEFTKEQLITRAQIMVRKHREMLSINPDYDGIARDVELFEIALSALTDGMEQEPVALPDYMTKISAPTIANILANDDENAMANAARILAVEVNFWRKNPLCAAPQLPQPAPEHKAAVATLESKGYTWHGGQFWKPPIGKAPAYITGEQLSMVIPLGVTWEDVPEEITEDDMGFASAWAHGFNQCRAAMLQGNHRDLSQPVDPQVAAYGKIMQQALPVNAFTNQDLEGMAHGDNPQSNAYRELLAYRLKAAALPAGLVAAMELAIEQSDRRAGEVRSGYPQHYHTVRGVWDQSNGCIAHEPCSVCALWDEMRDYLAAPQQEVK